MNRFFSFMAVALALLGFSACGGLTQLQDSVSHFAQATHAASNAETAFLNAVLKTDCEDQFYKSAYQYSTNTGGNFQLVKYCSPSIITPEQIEIRNSLMDAIVLYADKMQALASSDNDKQLDTNSQTLAKNLNNLATTGGVKLKDPAIVQGVQAAVIAIADMALDKVIYDNLQTAADKMQPHLKVVVKALKDENFGFGQAMTASGGAIEMNLRAVISLSHEKECPATDQRSTCCAADTFFNIINSRNILTSFDFLTKQSLTKSTPPADAAKPVNEALDAIVSGNEAIAKKQSASIYAAANNMYKRAVAAKDTYSAIATGK